MACGELGQPGEATEGLLAARAELAGRPLDEGLDPLAADVDRSLAELALLRGEAAAAADALARLAEAESGGGDRGGPPRPAHGWTLVLLARAAARLGDTQHPVILTARCDEAERRTAVGDTRQAARLLAPVLDRTLLVHGRPALGEAHPLLTRARTLAERLGITVPYTLPGLDEASLDLDV